MQPTLDQLCSGSCDRNVSNTIRHCQDVKKNHRLERNGYTKSKDYRYLAEIPMWVLFHPEFSKYFHPDMDDHERQKHLLDFLKKYGQGFLVVDKL